jgi:hypothetical protein
MELEEGVHYPVLFEVIFSRIYLSMKFDFSPKINFCKKTRLSRLIITAAARMKTQPINIPL